MMTVPNAKTTLVELRDGSKLPQFGLGTFLSEVGECKAAVEIALGTKGYIMVDTASMYKNEADVGAAIKALGLKREDYYVVTKLLPDDHGYDNCIAAAKGSMEKLGVAQCDLYLIHNPKGKDCVATWKAMLEVKKLGLAKAVGVSNFGKAQLEGLKATGLEMPEVNQVELHCWNQQKELLAFHDANKITTMGYCPLARCQQFGKTALLDIAARLGKTEAQLCIRWSIQAGIITIPKSVKESRIEQNGNAADGGWELSPEDMATIAALDIGHKASGSVSNQDDPWADVK